MAGNNPEEIRIQLLDAALCRIFFQNFILICKCQKWSLNRGNLVSVTTKSALLSALFLFFRMLPFDCRLFPV